MSRINTIYGIKNNGRFAQLERFKMTGKQRRFLRKRGITVIS
jgi:hypothetical protein